MLERLTGGSSLSSRRLSIPKIKPRRETVITCDTSSAQKRAEAARTLLGCILAQALHDDMTQVEFTVDAQMQEMAMRYRGPADAESPQWWEMTAPPASEYPFLLQAIFYFTQLEPGLPIRGTIAVRHGRTDIEVDVELDSTNCIRLRWDC